MRTVRYTAAALAIIGGAFALLLARASVLYSQNTPQSSAAAARLVPFRASYLVRLAAWHPDRKTDLLRRAVRLNPFETEAWIDLGLESEFDRNNTAEAEHLFREAARTNHMFVPKWTLANFYFRHEQVPQFLNWARQTLEITPYSAQPVFAEMWLLLPDGAPQLAHAVPDNPNTLWQYAWYLSNSHQFAAIPPVIARLVHAAGPAMADNFGKSTIVGPILDHMLQSGYASESLQIWRSLQEGAWVHTRQPNTSQPLSNGDFGIPIWPHGFDWLPITTPGITTEQHPQAHEFQIEFSGDQPDPCPLLQQWIPLESQRIYTVHWSAKADTPDTAADAAWHLRTPTGAELLTSPALGTGGTWTFTFPDSTGAYLLSLEYARQPGYVRAKGLLTLTEVSVVSARE
jgi:hypothetical protein